MGRRLAVEELFSSIKRIFGETVRAASPDEMILEVKRALKLSYIANIDNTWFLGSGIYLKGEEASGL